LRIAVRLSEFSEAVCYILVVKVRHSSQDKKKDHHE
jgi:hypothetical protein